MKKTVFVGLSGGVDSAVSAAILKKEGFEVVGVFIKTWHPDFLECNEEEERKDAMRIAAYLDIPFLTFDLEDVYKKEVADYMIAEYKAGRTPNPDVMCNKEVKFGAFLKKALAMGADYVATGHYANIAEQSFSQHARFFQRKSRLVLGTASSRDKLLTTPSSVPAEVSKSFVMLKSKDPAKDQSYFLWTLKQEQLSKIIFPVGGLKKSEVRKLAEKFKLPVAEKKDSQGICFLGAIDLKEFLKHYIKEKKGKVLDVEGKEIGHHDGSVFYTLGERHGFTVVKKSPNDKPYYIVSKDIKKNTLTVSQDKIVKENFKNNYLLENTNWIGELPDKNKSYVAQIRYHGEFLPCKVKAVGPERSRRAEVTFKNPILVASGQSVVVYEAQVCLGGGVVI